MPTESELLHALVHAIPSMVAYWDASLRCRFANRAYEQWFGVTPETLIGKHIRELLGPLYPLNLPYIEGALRGERQEFEREIPDPAGGPARHSLAHYVPDVVDGVVRGFFVLVTDVSSLKRTELALRESEERFRLTVDEAPIGMALVALDGRFFRVNRALCELVGYAPEELVGLTFQAITHPEDLDADLLLAGQLARGEIPRYELEKRYIRKDGAVVDVMLSGSAVRGPDGAPRYFIAQIEDITERKRIARERALLAEAGPLLAASLDLEETLTRVAELAVREFADHCVVDLVDEQGHPRRLRAVSRDPSKAWIGEVLTRIPLRADRPYLLRTVLETREPICVQHPSPEFVASFAHNAEHRRALEAAEIDSLVGVPLLAHGRLVGVMAFVASSPARLLGPSDVRLATELAQRAALSIENAQLYGAARRATQARDDILGIVAHDLRSPLNGIQIQATIVRRLGADAAKRGEAIDAIQRAASRMNRLIQDLLDVTRLEAGRLSVEVASVSAHQLVAEVVESQQALAAAASLALETDEARDLPDVLADRDRISQVFENLVGNAIKFTPPGGCVRIGAAPREGHVLFWVADTGRGIPPEEQAHVFDRFWQARRAERHGAGLGLPIARGVVEAHNGRIWVESAPGAGTTFYFTLPTADGARPAAPPAA